ncbi:hypothetical protein KP509_11G097800 [Ceratopteris richardii]|nr:hypothetical protein KP509_11G097800 [Ceratopteris richardii]
MVELDSNPAVSSGLLLSSTPAIDEFLRSAVDAATLPLQQGDPVPYKLLRDAWVTAPLSSRPRWHQLLAGSTFVFRSPKPREKSDELKARLARLQEIAERNAYQDLVKDVIPKQDEEFEYFSTYKNQLGFGVHVIFIMFTGYLAGYFLFRSQFRGNSILHAAGGVSGMVLGMLVETMLFIIRASKMDDQHRSKKAAYPSRPKKD